MLNSILPGQFLANHVDLDMSIVERVLNVKEPKISVMSEKVPVCSRLAMTHDMQDGHAGLTHHIIPSKAADSRY